VHDGATLCAGPTSVAQIFRNDPKMAYIKLPTTSDAILALLRTHQFRLRQRSLRVAFAAPSALQQFNAQQQQQGGAVQQVDGSAVSAASADR
jgi:hypothetical protein